MSMYIGPWKLVWYKHYTGAHLFGKADLMSKSQASTKGIFDNKSHANRTFNYNNK